MAENEYTKFELYNYQSANLGSICYIIDSETYLFFIGGKILWIRL